MRAPRTLPATPLLIHPVSHPRSLSAFSPPAKRSCPISFLSLMLSLRGIEARERLGAEFIDSVTCLYLPRRRVPVQYRNFILVCRTRSVFCVFFARSTRAARARISAPDRYDVA